MSSTTRREELLSIAAELFAERGLRATTVRDIADATAYLTLRDSIGLSILLAKGRTLFVADTSIHELPDAAELAEIAIKAAQTGHMKGQLRRLETLGVPVVAALNGAAMGGGVEIAGNRSIGPFAVPMMSC